METTTGNYFSGCVEKMCGSQDTPAGRSTEDAKLCAGVKPNLVYWYFSPKYCGFAANPGMASKQASK